MFARAILLAFAAVLPLMDLVFAQPPAVAAKKYALLVGVNEYDNRKLANLSDAERDATELAKVLRANGFELTTSGIDGSKAVGLAAGTVGKFEVAPGVFMEFCWIPPGEAQLGSPRAEQDYLTKTFHDGNRPEWLDGENESTRGVFKSKPGFWLGKYEVTQGEWEKVMGANPSNFNGKKDNQAKNKDTSRFPVENVSWDDIQQ